MADTQFVAERQSTTRLVECVEQTVMSTFEMICGEEPNRLGRSEDNSQCDGMTGIISLVGDVSWSLLLCLPRETSVAMASKFAGFEIPFDSSDMGDVVGELANVLAGDAAARLEAQGIKVNLSLPTVARGKEIDFMLPAGIACTRLDFSSVEGLFWAKVAIGDNNVKKIWS